MMEDAVEGCLERVSEAVSRLTRAGVDLDALEPGIDWGKIRGFGNRLRHEYDQIGPLIVQSVLSRHLTPLKEAAERLEQRFAPD
jgi:uncharacterized protein with HEPN domain